MKTGGIYAWMRRACVSGVLAVAALTQAVGLQAQEWTRFRGPNGTGISDAKGIPTDIGESCLSWKVELPGSGHSSPVIWGDKVFVTCTGDKSGGISLLCLNAKDGKTEWKRDFALAPFSKHKFNSFASATPAVDAERVYVVWNEPDHYLLTALDHAGKTVWQRDFGTYASQHGCGMSPVLYDDKLVLGNFQDDPEFAPGTQVKGKSSVIAVEARTGKTLWETPRRTTVVAYSTPCLYEPKNGKRALIFNSQSHGISAMDPDNGKVLWEYDKAFDKRSVSSPIIAGDLIYGSCGSGGGGNYVTAVKAGDGPAGRKAELAYEIKKSAPYVPTGISKDGRVWLWSDAGILTCINAANGEIKYQERVGGNFFGSPVWIDGRLFGVSTSGEVAVVDGADGFKVLHRYALNELCHSSPAVAGGKLFIRTEKHLWSFGGKKGAVGKVE
jgi:outer membrane protein assembly factor BamB